MSSKEARVQNIPFEIAGNGSLALPGGHWDWIYVAELSAGAALLANGPGFNVPLVVGRRISRGDPITQSILIENLGSGVASGVLFVGSGDVRDSTVVGTVSVTNADKERTEAGIAFMQSQGMSAVAASFGYVYLANPVGSGVVLVVNKVIPSKPTGGGGVAQLFQSTDYVSLEAEAGFVFSASQPGTSKFIGGADSVALVRRGYSSGISHTNKQNIANPDLEAQAFNELRFTEPYIISEGMSLGVHSSVANEIIRGIFEWFEEDA